MLFNGRVLILTFSGTQVRIAEIERLQSLLKVSMVTAHVSPSLVTGAVCCSTVQKSEQAIHKEISAVIRQITASVTFLPLLESACE